MQTIRIENGFGGTTNLTSMLNQFKTRQNDVTSAFATVRCKTNNASGGVGNMAAPLQSIEARIRREEKHREAMDQVASKVSGFLALTEKVDQEVAKKLEQNSAAFYSKYPHLKGKDQSLIDKILAGFKKFAEELDDLKKSIKKFWEKNKGKIIVTLIIVVCAVITIVGVIVATPAVLVPLLTGCGMALGKAIAISTAVYVTALVSTALSTSINVFDTWAEIDHPMFNSIQFLVELTSVVSTFGVDIGDIANGILRYSAKEMKVLSKMDPVDMAKVLIQNDEIRRFPQELGKGLSKMADFTSTYDYRKLTCNFGEMMQDKMMRSKGYKNLHDMVLSLDAPLHQGVDGIYQSIWNSDDIVKYVIGESKFNTSTLRNFKVGGKQMSQEWIESRLARLSRKNPKFSQELVDGIICSDYDRLLTNILPDGTLRLGHLDAAANLIDEMVEIKFDWLDYFRNMPKTFSNVPGFVNTIQEVFW